MNVKLVLVLALVACLIMDSEELFSRRRRRRRWFRIRVPKLIGIAATLLLSHNKTTDPLSQMIFLDQLECNQWEAIKDVDEIFSHEIKVQHDLKVKDRNEDESGVKDKDGPKVQDDKQDKSSQVMGTPNVTDDMCTANCKGCPASGKGCPQCLISLCRCVDDEEGMIEKLKQKEFEDWEVKNDELEEEVVEEIEETAKGGDEGDGKGNEEDTAEGKEQDRDIETDGEGTEEADE